MRCNLPGREGGGDGGQTPSRLAPDTHQARTIYIYSKFRLRAWTSNLKALKDYLLHVQPMLHIQQMQHIQPMLHIPHLLHMHRHHSPSGSALCGTCSVCCTYSICYTCSTYNICCGPALHIQQLLHIQHMLHMLHVLHLLYCMCSISCMCNIGPYWALYRTLYRACVGPYIAALHYATHPT
jgi:hypothetical protein